jgi:hypothetical protein
MEIYKTAKLALEFFADDIYTVDETGLFYHAMPDCSLSYKHATVSGSKKAIDRVTVLCCSNMTGTDKWKLLVTGNMAKHQCFKGIGMDSSVLH